MRRTFTVILALLALALGSGLLVAAADARGTGAIPRVDSISRNTSPGPARVEVVISGAHFTNVHRVMFGPKKARDVVVLDKHTIRVTSPRLPAGRTVRVRVLTDAGINDRATAPRFTSVAPTPPAPPVTQPPAPAAPTISSVTPNNGSTNGGTTITVSGTGFLPGTTVSVGGVAATAVVVGGPTSLTAITPAYVSGSLSKAVAVTTSAGSDSLPGAFTYVADNPSISSISPDTGTVNGGTPVTVHGTNFVPGTSLTIGGVAATNVSIVSATTLTAVAPAYVSGSLVKDVVVNNGTGTGTLTVAWTYQPAAPTISQVTPNSGPAAGGTTITVTGTGFTPTTTVTVGGAAATSVSSSDATTLTATTPAYVSGSLVADVAVTNEVATATAVDAFTYAAPMTPTVTALSPPYGPTAGGTLVTVSGSNFVSGDTSVTIGGSTVPATVVSATSLSFNTPPHAQGTVDATVTTPNGTSGNVPGGFTYESVPTATSLTPTAGPVAGNTSVTVTGANFVPGDTSVTIGGTTVPATVISSTSLSFDTPAHAGGNVSVSVSTSGGSSGLVPGGFTYESVPTAPSLAPAYGPVAGNTSVTVTGANFVPGDTTVTIGGTTVPATVISSTSLSFDTPAHAGGNVSVSVSTSGGSSGLVPGGFTYETAPAATSLSPGTGTTSGGTTVTIAGSGFVSGDTFVTIGGSTVPASVSNPTSLTFTTPAHAAGNVPVSVSTSGGASNTVSGGFTYVVPPTIQLISPNNAPTTGNVPIIITGTNFTGTSEVTVGGNAASFAVLNNTSISATVPAHAPGVVDVSVTTPAGTVTSASSFTYIAPTILP